LSRQKIIEDRKDYLLSGRRQEEPIRQQLLAEQRRLEAERQERKRLLRQVQARHLKEKVAQFSQTAIGQKV